MTPARIPFLDVGATYRELQSEIDATVGRVLSRGDYILGESVDHFERAWAAACGAKHCVGVGSGLDALILVLRAIGVGEGDEVVVPSHTFIATWLAVTAVGATVVPVEPDPTTFLITPAVAEAAISPRTAAVIPVHLYGRPVDVVGFDDLGRRHGVPVIHDAAQAHGATAAGRPVGCFGFASAWSFYPGKNLGAFGDAGAVTTDDDALADDLRMLRNYGSSRKYVHERVGTNSRLDELQAAILSAKLPLLEEWNSRRRRIADIYLRGLSGTALGLPPADSLDDDAWHLFVVKTERRDWLRDLLADEGVGTGVHYPIAPHLQGAYGGVVSGDFPVAEELARTVLSLPIGPHLSPDDAETTVREIRRILADHPV